MRTYDRARALIGTSVEASWTNGRVKRVVFREAPNGDVCADLLGTTVVKFTPDRVILRTGGYVTPTTFDGIAAALAIGRGDRTCGTHKRVPYVLWHRLREGMALDYNGVLLDPGTGDAPLAPPRRHRDENGVLR